MKITTSTKNNKKNKQRNEYTPESRREHGLPFANDEVFILLNTLYKVTSNQ